MWRSDSVSSSNEQLLYRASCPQAIERVRLPHSSRRHLWRSVLKPPHLLMAANSCQIQDELAPSATEAAISPEAVRLISVEAFCTDAFISATIPDHVAIMLLSWLILGA